MSPFAPNSLNGFLASTEGSDVAPEGRGYLGLEPYDVYWSRVRDMYSPFENGMKSGTARVFDHQIPGERNERIGDGREIDKIIYVVRVRYLFMVGSTATLVKKNKKQACLLD